MASLETINLIEFKYNQTWQISRIVFTNYYLCSSMSYINAFKENTDLIQKFGEGNAYLAWVMALYLDSPDAEQLAADSLTDDGNDKKIDFI
ncbi:MAG: hypothetical protein HC832_00970 [Leptolyngbyaceae cyanobacterium RM1_405_57]|nr:hypothetical protein [Leptolyngbyaceae cyanobacterium RM1_405_57]